MHVLAFQIPQILPSTTKKIVRPASGSISTLPFSPLVPRRVFRSSSSLQYREEPKYAAGRRLIRSHALNVGTGSGGYDERRENDSQSSTAVQHTETSSKMSNVGGAVGSSHERGADLLRKPAAPSPAANDEESAAEYSDDDESESKGGDGDTWVDWEDQILEDTVPLVGFVRMILHSGKYECGDRLSSEHERTILDRLLPYHPACEDKIGSGVDYITIGYHPTFGSSRCLFIVRKDGQLVDFSYWKCIKGLIRTNYPLYADSFILRHFRRRRRDN